MVVTREPVGETVGRVELDVSDGASAATAGKGGAAAVAVTGPFFAEVNAHGLPVGDPRRGKVIAGMKEHDAAVGRPDDFLNGIHIFREVGDGHEMALVLAFDKQRSARRVNGRQVFHVGRECPVRRGHRQRGKGRYPCGQVRSFRRNRLYYP